MKQIVTSVLANVRYVKKPFLLFVLFGLLSEILILSLPQLNRKMIYAIEVLKDADVLWYYAGWTAVVVVVFILADRIFGSLLIYVNSALYVAKEKEYRFRYVALDYQQVQMVGTGKILKRFDRGLSAEADIFTAFWKIIIHTLFRGSVIMTLFVLYEPRLGIVFAVVVLFLCVLSWFLYRRMQPITELHHALDESSSRDLVRIVTEWLLLRVCNKQSYERKQAVKVLDQWPRLDTQTEFYQSSSSYLLHLLLRLGEIVITVMVGLMVIVGDSTIAYLGMLGFYLWLLWVPLEKAVDELGKIGRMYASYRALQNFVAQQPTIVSGETVYEYGGGSFMLDDITFGYKVEQVPLFQDFSLSIAGGERVALVGKSGSGKSTLVKLLLRLYDVREGSIMIDGQLLSSLDMASYYRHIAYVSQEPALFDGSVRENLLYALEDTTDVRDDVLRAALAQAEAAELVRNLPEGLDTWLGERGIKLSGGERQRVALARVFLKQPSIIILDEPTAALDSESEAAITQALERLFVDRTVIIIAHRLQTVKQMDRIVVMEHGSIVEQGSHEQLVAAGGQYAQLVALQNTF